MPEDDFKVWKPYCREHTSEEVEAIKATVSQAWPDGTPRDIVQAFRLITDVDEWLMDRAREDGLLIDEALDVK